MRAQDIRLNDVFEFLPAEGIIRFRDGRMLIIDAEAIGRLRELLITFLGEPAAIAILSQYGYTTGYDDALKLRDLFVWDSETDWIAAGPQMHMLEGIVQVIPKRIAFDREKQFFDMHGEWINSYEAFLHTRLYGRADQPVCWTQTGYASGYASAFMGFDCICIEEKCMGRGDEVCYWHIKKKEDWGPEAESYIHSLELMTSNRAEFYSLIERQMKPKR